VREQFRKTRLARRKLIPVVSPLWVEKCWETWERVDYSDFALTDPVTPTDTGVRPLRGGGAGDGELPGRARTTSVEFDALCTDALIIRDKDLRAMDDEVDAISDSDGESEGARGEDEKPEDDDAEEEDDGEDGEEDGEGEWSRMAADIESQFEVEEEPKPKEDSDDT